MRYLRKLLLALCAALFLLPACSQARPGFGMFGLHRHSGKVTFTPPPPAAGVTYDTSIGTAVDANGRASLPLHAGASRYYVNSSTGSDANTCTQAKSASTPKATVSSGLSCAVNGNGDQILIAQGTSYAGGLTVFGAGGFSAQYPTVIESYDPTDPTNEAKLGIAGTAGRPVLNTGGTVAQSFMQGTNLPDYIVVRGLDFNPGSGVPLAEVKMIYDGTGGSTSDYILWENDIFRYTQLTFDNAGSVGGVKAKKFIVRNCSFYDEYGDHSQGLYISNVDGITIEDDVFWANGRLDTASRDAAQSSGGASIFNHPIYDQSSADNTVVRRSFFADTATDGGNLKGGGIYQSNLVVRVANAFAFGSGNSYSIDKPFGAYIDGSYNATIGSNIVNSTSGAIGWGVHTNNGRSNSLVRFNVFARNDQVSGNALMADSATDVTYNKGNTNYTTFDHNVSDLWSASGSTTSFTGGATTVATVTNNVWDDPTSGTNANVGSVSFPNAYTETSLLTALGYASESAAITDWINHPEQHKWENGPALMLAGYGVTKAQQDLSTDMRITAGLATSGMFIGTLDGFNLTSSGLPTCVTIDSDGRAWRADTSCTPSSGTASITESNGTNSHTTSIPWTISAQPVLSSVTVTPGSTSATANLTSDTGNGKLYWIATTSATAVDWQHLHIGYTQDLSGGVGVLPTASGSPSVTASGAQPAITIPGLTASTGYHFSVFQLGSNNNPSLVSAVSFTTSAAGAATLTSPTGTQTGSTTATLGVTTDTGSGTLYAIATTSATPPSVAQIQAGDDSTGALAAFHTSQAVSATGAQSASATGLTASTTYYGCFQQHTTVDSSVVCSTSFTTSSGAWTPASLGTNLALDFTELDSTHLFQDTGCTTAVTADLQTAKCIKDTSSGKIATNSTGWVYHANAGKPYLQMDGTSSFTTSTNITYADGSGQWTAWVTASFSKNSLNDILHVSGNTLLNSNQSTGLNEVFARGTGGPWTDTCAAPALNTPAVVSGIVATASTECFLDNVGNGSTAVTGTLSPTVGQIIIGNGSQGPFYGALFAKGDQTANRANAQTYMSGLH